MPRSQSPCEAVIERDRVLLFDRPRRHFGASGGVEPPVVEMLLAPFHVDGRPAGTVWAVSHTPERRFDAEDARLLTSLARFAAAGHQLTTALAKADRARADVDVQVAERTAGLSASNAALRASGARVAPFVRCRPRRGRGEGIGVPIRVARATRRWRRRGRGPG